MFYRANNSRTLSLSIFPSRYLSLSLSLTHTHTHERQILTPLPGMSGGLSAVFGLCCFKRTNREYTGVVLDSENDSLDVCAILTN